LKERFLKEQTRPVKLLPKCSSLNKKRRTTQNNRRFFRVEELLQEWNRTETNKNSGILKTNKPKISSYVTPGIHAVKQFKRFV
jgi:hypothetical protein